MSIYIWGMNELDGTVALTDVGAQFNINVTSNVVTVDVDDVTDLAVEITDLGATLNPIKYVVADVKAKVYAKVIPAVLEAAQIA